jgi:hypothetical protein
MASPHRIDSRDAEVVEVSIGGVKRGSILGINVGDSIYRVRDLGFRLQKTTRNQEFISGGHLLTIRLDNYLEVEEVKLRRLCG